MAETNGCRLKKKPILDGEIDSFTARSTVLYRFEATIVLPTDRRAKTAKVLKNLGNLAGIGEIRCFSSVKYCVPAVPVKHTVSLTPYCVLHLALGYFSSILHTSLHESDLYRGRKAKRMDSVCV